MSETAATASVDDVVTLDDVHVISVHAKTVKVVIQGRVLWVPHSVIVGDVPDFVLWPWCTTPRSTASSCGAGGRARSV